MKKILPKGFQACGVASGIKKNGKKDLGLIFSQAPAHAAAVFTKNRVKAAPVLLDKERIRPGVCRAIVVNSGNANCCTGDQGIHDAKVMAASVASGLGISEELVLVSSTGIIGQPMPIGKIEAAIPGLIELLSIDGVLNFARSIMTTDTLPKVVIRQGQLNEKTFTVTGVAKGAGMIRPDMATMLCFICTDADVAPDLLQNILFAGTEQSFNRITIDGDTSTNDMVLMMANGLSDIKIETPKEKKYFRRVLNETMISLAKEMVKDGEGATKFIEIAVKGAASEHDAHQIADTVANSSLIKTAFFGEDANWGRIIAAVGRADVPIQPSLIDIYVDDVMMVKKGLGCGKVAEIAVTSILKKSEFTISIDLHIGGCHATVFTCDLSLDYVKINADYRS
ncbi:MAG: bifunctional glutamate N-acetyltransferase/amino-acid acetyltransferase ArgJ [Desulfobacterales bacterium]